MAYQSIESELFKRFKKLTRIIIKHKLLMTWWGRADLCGDNLSRFNRAIKLTENMYKV